MNNITKCVQLSTVWRQLCGVCHVHSGLAENRTIFRCLGRHFSCRLLSQSSMKSIQTMNKIHGSGSVRHQLYGVRGVATVSGSHEDKTDVTEKSTVTQGRRGRRLNAISRVEPSPSLEPAAGDSADGDDWDDPLAERLVAPDEIRSHFPVSFNLAAYVDGSDTLQQLIRLGVDLSRLERMRDVASWLVKLDYQRDMASHVEFLHEAGVTVDQLGHFITRNPRIFEVPVEDLQVRLNYLESKKFDSEGIARILIKAPQFIQNSTKQIDHRLGIFQREFQLSGDEVRHLTLRMPKVILCNLRSLKETKFSLTEQMGFSKSEMKDLLLRKPKIFVLSRPTLLERFDYIHNELGFSHATIVEFPGCLVRRKFLVKQRHQFLQALDRAQYDPTAPLYISLRDLTTGSDSDFCHNAAKTSVQKFNDFLMTL